MLISYNRSLCELEFKNKFLTEVDVELFEYVWMKIRDKFKTPTNKLTINFKDFSKFTEKHRNQNQRLKESVKRLGNTTIITNTKSDKPSEEYNFKFNVFNRETKKGKIPKGFTVEFDEDIYKLFDKPKSYSKYNEEYIYSLSTKYSKLLYKFLIGYKFKKDDFYVNSDALIKILNIDPNQKDKNKKIISYSYIQSQFIYGSVKRINANTDLKVTLKKYCNDYDEKGNEIVKYKVSIVKYKGEDNLSEKYAIKKIDKKIDKVIQQLKSDIDEEIEGIPIFVINTPLSKDYVYINNKYQLTDSIKNYTDTPSDTLKKLDELKDKGDSLTTDIFYMDNYTEEFEKVCLLSMEDLSWRGLV